MKEFMLLVRNRADHQDSWTDERHFQFLRSCETYISELKREGKLIAAQPLIREGAILSRTLDQWLEIPFNETAEVQVGYYHVYANDLNDAIAIAKRNPEFEFSKQARVEVRPIKSGEKTTGFVYPKTV